MDIAATSRRQVIGGLLSAGFPISGCAATTRPAVPKQVLAFYYGWYGTPKTGGWVHWQGGGAAPKQDPAEHTSAFGEYDSLDPAVVDRQLSIGKRAGLTGFISSWWGVGDRTDRATALLLQRAGAQGLKVCAYLEQEPAGPAHAEADLAYLVGTYGKNPAWLNVNGRPVIFLYDRAVDQVAPAAWHAAATALGRRGMAVPILIPSCSPVARAKAAMQVLDGVHHYSFAEEMNGQNPAQMKQTAGRLYADLKSAAAGKIFCATVSPGYDDTKLHRPPPHYHIGRYGLQTMTALWQAAIAAQPAWVVVDSFNEWHEGSEIEPSKEYGFTFVDLNGRYARHFLSS